MANYPDRAGAVKIAAIGREQHIGGNRVNRTIVEPEIFVVFQHLNKPSTRNYKYLRR